MIRFPNLIEWMDDMGMDELHALHKHSEQTFSDFVQNEYEFNKEKWEDEMTKHRDIVYRANSEKDIAEEMAKEVFCMILNKGNQEMKDIICENELAPDAFSASIIVESFWHKIIPAIEKTLAEI